MAWIKSKDVADGQKVTDERGRRLTKHRQISGGGLSRSRGMYWDAQGREVHLNDDTRVRRNG